MIADLVHALVAPWGEPLVRRALIETVLIGVAGGTLGCWVLFYGLAYGAESLAHSLLPGLVVAAFLGVPLLLGGAAGILVGAVAVAIAGQVRGIGRDTAVAVVVSTLFGLGVLLALSPDAPAGLQGLLFGDVLGVSDSDLALAGAFVLVLSAVLWVAYRPLLAVGFDRSTAAGLGVRAAVVDVALLAMLAAAIVVAVQGLGTLLVVAVLVGPASAARALTDRMRTMLLASAAVAIGAGIGGLYLSYYAGIAAGASIALALIAAALLAVPIGRLRAARAPRAGV